MENLVLPEESVVEDFRLAASVDFVSSFLSLEVLVTEGRRFSLFSTAILNK